MTLTIAILFTFDYLNYLVVVFNQSDLDKMFFRLSLYTGVILHELYLANMCYIKRKWDVGIKSDILKLIKEARQALVEVKDVLKYETTNPAGDKLLSLVENSNKEFYKWIERYRVKIDQDTTK